MFHELKANDFNVKNIKMDNDATIIARTKAAFDPSLHKFADFNHTKKNFTKLYEMKKAKRYQILGPKITKHHEKCFAYAVKFNNNTISLKKRLNSIPCHVFGSDLFAGKTGVNISKLEQLEDGLTDSCKSIFCVCMRVCMCMSINFKRSPILSNVLEPHYKY